GRTDGTGAGRGGGGGGSTVRMKVVDAPRDGGPVAIEFSVAVTRREQVGARISVLATVQARAPWTFTLTGHVTARTLVRGKVELTVTTDNASWLEVTHPVHGGVYVRPNVVIRG
ncbi:MAG: hypothetical protein ABMB14_33230, partial [Myxococcota bacterium]